MTDFSIEPAGFDAAFCTVDSFRHLQTDIAATRHLQNVAAHLKQDALYVLGLHLLPRRGVSSQVESWQQTRGRLRVDTTMSVMDVDPRSRKETIRMTLKVNTPLKSETYQSTYPLRTWTLRQFRQLLAKSGVFEIYTWYNHAYEQRPLADLDADTEDVILLLRKIA